MREVVQKVYKFNELTEEVQERVLEDHRYLHIDSSDWEEGLCENFKDALYADHFFRAEDASFCVTGCQGDGAGFIGEFETVENAINLAKDFDTKGKIVWNSIKDELLERGEVRVSQFSWAGDGLHEYNTYIEILIDGVPMEEDEKYKEFVEALETWKKEECERLFTEADGEMTYRTSDEYLMDILNDDYYEFYADGTVFFEHKEG